MTISKINFVKYIIVFLGIALNTDVCAQTSDLGRIEYTFIPQTNSNNSLDRFRGFVNFPIKVNDSGCYLVPGIEFRNMGLDIEDEVPFDTSNLKNFQMFRMSLGYTFKMKNNWRVAVSAGAEIASNFEHQKTKGEDYRFTGAFYLIKDRTSDTLVKADRWVLGLEYTTNAGRPFPLPIINYYKKFDKDWSYTLGIPKMNLKHNLTYKQTLQAFVTVDGFFSNLQNDLPVPTINGLEFADNISMTMILGGLGYEYYFSKHILYYIYGGHSIHNKVRLRDGQWNKVYTINQENTFYFRTGIKFKI